MARRFISIGETIHASIPKPAKAMKQLWQSGPDAFANPSEPLDYIKSLIQSQADGGAAYIAINVDAFGEDDPAIAVAMMVEYVKLVAKWSKGVPVCIDSGDDNVLVAGLEQWYNTDRKVKPPLLNSVKVYTMDMILPLKSRYDFCFIGMLMSEDKPTGPGGSHTVDELFGLAKQIFDKAVDEYGFEPGQIFFDTTVFPLAIDMPMEPGVPGYTFRTFETIKKIRNDARMKDVHFAVGVSNCCRDLPARKIGICRAYVQKAMEYGLDGGIVNILHNFGTGSADQDLIELIDAYAKIDGSAQRTNDAMMLMGRFCAEARKP